MENVFLKIVNMSIAAGWLILGVMVLRLLLKRAPKWISCVLWGIAAVRLISPFSIESVLSLIPSAETISQDIMYAGNPAVHTGVAALNSMVNPVIAGSFTPDPVASANPLQIWIPVAAVIWILGIAVFLIYGVVSYVRLQRKVRAAIPLRENLWICDEVKQPFLMGILRPRIYLPSDMEEAQIPYVAAHEKAHLMRHDNWWKPFGFILLAVYWFHPLVWAAYILLCRDIELACDERVIREMDMEKKKAYSEALLSCSTQHRMITACPLAFGEVGVKERVKSVLHYKKPVFWVLVVAVLACIAAAVCFLTDPKGGDDRIDASDTAYMTHECVYMNPASSSFPPYGSDGKRYLIDKDEDGKLALITIDMRNEEVTSSSRIQTSYLSAPYWQDIDREEWEKLFWWEAPDLEKYKEKKMVRLENGDYLFRMDEELWYAEYRDEKIGVWTVRTLIPEKMLTLDDVVRLSRKGKELGWKEFEDYFYIETGSGLYIRRYDIDGQFSLWIGGGWPTEEEEPMYIRLVASEEEEAYIDIRTEDVSEFFSKYKK